MPELPDERFDALLSAAHTAADTAGAVILPHFRTRATADHKQGASFDPVTEADRAAELRIRDILVPLFPDHGVIGEEFGAERETAEYCWTVDPIDGTRAFIMGQPLWGLLIGLLWRGRPLLGLMDQPFTGERFWSGREHSYWRRGDQERPMRTRPCAALGLAMLACTSPDLFSTESDRERFERLSRQVRMRRFGGDCYNYCLLADGHIDLVVEADLKVFDIAPLIPIIERAGGVVTTWEGSDAIKGGRILASGDPRLHEQAVKILGA